MGRNPPRYDLAHAAPEPLALVQRFVNTIDLSHEREWLIDWLAEQGVAEPSEAELNRARRVREAIRALLDVNDRESSSADTDTLNEAAKAARLTIDFTDETLLPLATGLDGVLGRVSAVCFTAVTDGTWRRLKCCQNHECRWAFYDTSKNRSATWCSMQLCGNRAKTLAYRQRAGRRGG